ncbi:hypothetical protein UG56_019975 [Nocardioides luteus]|uniref:Uncharacterized protein n=1 Tax=Nocardioides luteus TaxID=1844 RepID=A0A1J4N3U6_9ACTN|nr:hypothetical protein UG56_019975 [Nocardioides luteus]
MGAGDNTHCVRVNGRAYEALVALVERRDRCDLYHSALEVLRGGARYVIEMAPVWSSGAAQGTVSEGPVGLRVLGRSRAFRYEVRCWRDGVIPDAAAAVVGGPVPVETDSARTKRLLELVPSFPTATWGRDELRTGEMWNSNSLISWLLAASGHDTGTITPPDRGRSPGWAAGLVVAARQGADAGRR